MSDRPTITVLITCYKEGVLLRRALDSLTAQTDRDFELVVVNDASPCETTNSICRSITQSERVKVIVKPQNGGPSAARNTGIEAASGDVIVLLDGDDVLSPDCIELTRRAFMMNPQADYCFGNYVRRNADTGESAVVDCSVLTDTNGWMDPRKYALNYIFLCTSPYRKKIWRRIGGYRSSLDGSEDVDLWMRAMAAGAKGVYVPRVTYEWHRSGQGVNATVSSHTIWEAHLRNAAFHKQFGNWPVLVEGFLDYVISEYSQAGARSVARGCLPKVFPLPMGCWSRYLRALLINYLPVNIVSAIKRIH